MFWTTLIGGTVLAAWLIPRLLDSSQEQGYKELDALGRPPLTPPRATSALTRFPVRPFPGADAAERLPRQAFPGELPSSDPSSVTALPQRQVPDAPGQPPAPVTSRVRVARDSSAYEQPLTTSRVLGQVAAGTSVRWRRQVQPGWEEILLRDGRSVYMQTAALEFSDESARPTGQAQPGAEQVDLAQLPATVDSFLLVLRDGDLLRAGTYVSASAPSLDSESMGALMACVGPEAQVTIGRVEPVPDQGPGWRAVVLEDPTGARVTETLWTWEARGQRWLLSSW